MSDKNYESDLFSNDKNTSTDILTAFSNHNIAAELNQLVIPTIDWTYRTPQQQISALQEELDKSREQFEGELESKRSLQNKNERLEKTLDQERVKTKKYKKRLRNRVKKIITRPTTQRDSIYLFDFERDQLELFKLLKQI